MAVVMPSTLPLIANLDTVPDNVSLEQAGASARAGQTALQFVQFVDIKAGEHVVMNAPAGGVGQLVVQLLMKKRRKITSFTVMPALA